LVAIPIISMLILIYPRLLSDMDKSLYIKDPESKICFDRIAELHERVTLANHPFLAIIFMTERSIVMQIFSLLFALFRGSSQPVGSDDVMVFIEKKMPRRRTA
jgi:hypothetical protein